MLVCSADRDLTKAANRRALVGCRSVGSGARAKAAPSPCSSQFASERVVVTASASISSLTTCTFQSSSISAPWNQSTGGLPYFRYKLVCTARSVPDEYSSISDGDLTVPPDLLRALVWWPARLRHGTETSPHGRQFQSTSTDQYRLFKLPTCKAPYDDIIYRWVRPSRLVSNMSRCRDCGRHFNQKDAAAAGGAHISCPDRKRTADGL